MTLKDKFNKINQETVLLTCQDTQKIVQSDINFGYNTDEEIIKDLHEEIDELRTELSLGDRARIAEELGDVVFVLCNLANQYNISVEDSLNYSTMEYQRRIEYIENKVGGDNIKNLTRTEMITLWKEAKKSR